MNSSLGHLLDAPCFFKQKLHSVLILSKLGEWIQQPLVSGCGHNVCFTHTHMCIFIRVHVEIHKKRQSKHPGKAREVWAHLTKGAVLTGPGVERERLLKTKGQDHS